MEGYSSEFVESEIKNLECCDIHSLYDPFSGSGTTLLVASMKNIKPYYSETNPFMNFVVKGKINSVILLTSQKELIPQFLKCKEIISNANISYKLDTWDGFEKYYSHSALNEILYIKSVVTKNGFAPVIRDMLMLALSSILVESSKMIRRGDLRFANNNEKKTISVLPAFVKKIDSIIYDIDRYGNNVKQSATLLASDARDVDVDNLVECVITSPPYLNGTNYIRNTKLELKLNDYVVKESDLSPLHAQGIVSGINNVSKKSARYDLLPCVESIITQLESVAYDKRIPTMVACYFYDMNNVFSKLSRVIKNNGVFIMDIGDSQFAGIHIPTHEILTYLCHTNGFIKYSEDILRVRHSKNGMPLSQRILRFRLRKS